jgi:histidinol dehydrogenase
MLRLKSSDPDFGRAFTRLVKDRRESDENVARDVQTIIEDVRLRGDAALAEYTERFDNHLPGDDDWRIAPEACRDAFETLAPDLRAALELAAQRIRTYHEAQRPQDRDYVDDAGIRLGAKWRAVDGAGFTCRAAAPPIHRPC